MGKDTGVRGRGRKDGKGRGRKDGEGDVGGRMGKGAWEEG